MAWSHLSSHRVDFHADRNAGRRHLDLVSLLRQSRGNSSRDNGPAQGVLKNNSSIPVNYGRARREGRPISTAPAESVMNHLVNRRMLKRQQMRWSVEGAQLMLQTRVDLLDGYLLRRFRSLYPHFRSPDLRVS